MNIKLKEELSFVISERVIEIFKVMFGVDVEMIDENTSDFDDDDLVSKMILRQDDLTVLLRFAFRRELLTPLLATIYDPIIASHETTMEDSVCEITNIVCGGLKKHMNEVGYNLEMEIPSIEYSFQHYSQVNENCLNINFTLQDSSFLVDLKMNESAQEGEDLR